MATIRLYNTDTYYMTLTYTASNGVFHVSAINGYYSYGKQWDATVDLTHKITVNGVTKNFTSYKGSGNSGTGCGFNNGSGYDWDIGSGIDVNVSGVGTVSVTMSSNTGNNGAGKTFTSRDNVNVPPAFVANTVNSQSGSITPYIPYLKAYVKGNATYNGYEDLHRQIEINPVSGGDDTWVNEFSVNQSGEKEATLTVTGDQINSKGLLGTALRTNQEFYYINGASADYYYGNYTPPSNLMTAPSISGKPSVSKITASQIQISVPTASNWVRSESSAFYCNSLVGANSSGTTTGTVYAKWGMSAQSLGTVTMNLGVNTTGSITNDPSSETVSAGSAGNYNLVRGSTYYFYGEAITKFLGVRKNTYSSLSDAIYIPYLPTLTKNSFSYEWANFNGYIAYHLVSANITLNNPNNENIGNRYLSMNNNKRPISSISGNIWYTDNTNNHWDVNLEYKNSAVNGACTAWMYYATNKYSESIIDPVAVTDNYSLAANLVNCALGNIEIDLRGNFKAGNCSFNMPTTDTSKLPIGTMNATLQISKNSGFTQITHQQTKTVTKYGTTNNMFDDIELDGGDLGTLYIRIKWNLGSSSNYYNFGDVYSPVKTIEFTGIIPKIDDFTAYINSNKKIVTNVTESTGIPIPRLYIDVYRIEGGGVYQSFEVQNGVDFELPYTEPGTIWYLEARAVNAIGTVFALVPGTSDKKIIALQIPYTTTEDYDEKANPIITANKIQLDNRCNMQFNWTKIVTDVYKVQYNIRMYSSNQPITPMEHNDKQPGYNYTFTGRKDAEMVYFELETVLYNSFGEVIITYSCSSNEIELDAVDLNDLTMTYHTNQTYHSIEYVLDNMIKNSYKLVKMYVGLAKNENWSSNSTLIDLSNLVVPSSKGLTSVKNSDGSITTKGTPTGNYAEVVPRTNINNLLTDGKVYTAGMKTVNGLVYTVISIVNKKTNAEDKLYDPGWSNYQFVVDKTKYDYYIDVHSCVVSNWNSYKEVTNTYYLVEGIPPEVLVRYEFIGDEQPGFNSLDLSPIDNVLFENLLADTQYRLIVYAMGMNPLDAGKISIWQDIRFIKTNEFLVYPVRNIRESLTNAPNNRPTANSNVTLTWDEPQKGDVDVTDYIVAYRKQNQDYKEIIVQEKMYTLAHEIVPLANEDVVYIRIGARYIDWFGNYVIKWLDAPSVIVSPTNYIYYDCIYPNVERAKYTMYKLAEGKSNEDLVRNIHINED